MAGDTCRSGGAIDVEVRSRVARVTVNRPEKRNALTVEMWADLRRALEELDDRGDLVAVILRGAGGSFSAGSDLDGVRSSDPERFGELQELAESTVLRLRDLRSATFAEIDGPCFGAGCSLALACDVRVCSPRSRFGIPVLRHGIVYEPVHVQRLVEVVGPGPAALLLYGGEEWTAQEAVTQRLVDRCSEDPRAALEQVLGGLISATTPVVRATTISLRAMRI